jgi:hypothetical protein
MSLADGISLDDAGVGATPCRMENTIPPIQNDDAINASIDPKQERSMLLLYLNKDIFLDEGDTVKGIVQAAKDLKIDIVLVHEQDRQEGGCEFSQFFEQTPQVLIDNPYELYHEMATPLHTRSEYRIVSLRKIILRLGQVDE